MPARTLFLAALPLAIASSLADPDAFSSKVDPFIAENCLKCHGEKKQKGDFRLDTLSRDLADPAVAISWMDVVEMIEGGEMPPEEVEERPSDSDVSKFTGSIRDHLLVAAKSHNNLDRPRIRRLSHSAMDNTVRDLTGVDLPLSTGLPHDPEVAGFDNVAETMTISQEVMRQLQLNAHKIAAFAITEEPNPRIQQTFQKKTLATGRRVSTFGDFRATFSNKNSGYAIGPDKFKTQFPGYYDIEVIALAFDNRRKFPAKDGKVELKKSDKQGLRPEIPPNQPRFAQIRALEYQPDGSLPEGSGASPPPSRIVGEFAVSAKPANPVTRVWLNANETISIYYGSGRRLTAIPTAMLKGKEEPVGEALYIRAVAVAGPVLPSWPLPLEQALRDQADPNELIEGLLVKAFRRPVEPSTLALYRSLYDERLKQEKDQRAALRQVLEAALCSPRFLFNYDDGAESQGWIVACRLSYFLWNSMPDEELFNLAANGELLAPGVIAQQAKRMLADPRSERFVTDFSGQWLSTRHVGKMVPDQKLFPAYDKNLEDAFKVEPVAFFNEVLQRNLSIANFIDSDFAMLNERLAGHYGIDGVEGPEFRPVALPKNSPRGGVLAQAGVLAATSDGTRTSPVIRGIWVLENILGGSISPPPANVEPLEPDVRGALNIREMLEKHRKVETCNDCHRKIDPLGFALENFDPIGAWRDHYDLGKGKNKKEGEIVTSGRLPDGTKIKNFESLKAALVKKQDRFAATLAEKLFAHAMGRLPTIHENHVIEAILAEAAATDYRLADLIVAICQSESFASVAAPTAVAAIE